MRRIFMLFSFITIFFLSACGGQEEATTAPQLNAVSGELALNGADDLSSGGLHSLDDILNDDGTIDFSRVIDGSFDPRGFRMIIGPDGAPIFEPYLGQGLNDHWVSMNGDAAGAFTVYAVAVSGSTVYVGGDFTSINGVAANYIAQWNGTTWSALGTGTNAAVYALAVSGTDLYVGGTFVQAGGASARRVARWNGTAWSPLGISAGNANGAGNNVFALAVSGTNLYVGGQFTDVRQSSGTDINAGRIARWDTTTSTWSRLGGTAANNGFNNIVRALAVSGTTLYAGGQFTTVRNNAGTNVTVNRIAQWDGTTWSRMGGTATNTGFDNIVYALTVSGTTLYAGGQFTQVYDNSGDYMPVNRVAQWDGTTWSALAGGGMTNNIVYALTVLGSDLYAAGTFTSTDGGAANRIAKWNGVAWSVLGGGLSTTGRGLAADGSANLYVGGAFATVGNGLASRYIARYITGSVCGDGTIETGEQCEYTAGAWPTGCNSTTCNCDTHYTASGGTCVADTQLVACTNTLPTHASWTTTGVYGGGNLTQTWDGSAWTPATDTCPWTCDTDYAEEGGLCINSKEVPCDTDNDNPAHSSDTIANVTVTYTTAGGWTAPADCAWTCDTDYAEEGGLCINSKDVDCAANTEKPANSHDIVVPVTIHYTTADGWETPAVCEVWVCDTDYALVEGACINTLLVQCNEDNANPENSTDTIADVTIHYTTDGGWTAPADCAWTCDTDYTLEGGLCINQKDVSCDTTNNPANSVSTIVNVTITYTTDGGWTAPADCAWICDTDYAEEGGLCINSKDVPCDEDNANPENSTDTIANVTITYTTAGGWTAPAACAWTCDATYHLDINSGTCVSDTRNMPCTNPLPTNASWSASGAYLGDGTVDQTWDGTTFMPKRNVCPWACDTDYILEGGLCINSKEVPCDTDNENPAHSNDTIANVTVTYTTAGGWTAPADCAWTCDTDYILEGGLCINSKEVPCDTDNGNPANSSDTIANVTITYTTAGGWTAPADCAWTCDTDYAEEGGLCINSKDVDCAENTGKPVNSQDIVKKVTITYTTGGGWTLPATCDWECITDFALFEGACIDNMDVECNENNGNPPHSTDVVIDVTIHYTTAGGWEAPALCEWDCDGGYNKDAYGFCNLIGGPCDPNQCADENKHVCADNGEGGYTCSCNPHYSDDGNGACVAETQIVACVNLLPENAVWILIDEYDGAGNLEQTWNGTGWAPLADTCPWDCDAGFFLDGGKCVECLIDGDCDDNSVCTGAETCKEGLCVAGEPLDCADDNVCTTDSCDPVGGCVNDYNTDTCDDGNELTENDVCFEGACNGELMSGICGNAITVGELPYTTTGNTATRPNSLEEYGAGCAAATQATVDAVYELTVETGVEYQIQVVPTDGGDLALNLLGVCGAGEACLAMASDSGAGETEYLTYTAAQSGMVYLSIEGSGAYELSIAIVEQPDDDTIVTDDIVTDDIVTDDVLPDEIVVTDEVVTDDIVTDDVVTDTVVTDDVVTDTVVTDKDTVGDKDTVVTDKDTVVTDDETPDESTDELGDGLLDDSDLLVTDNIIGPKGETGCGCTMVF